MQKRVFIFKSFEEQEKHHKQIIKSSTATDRFKRLYQMQQFALLLHPAKDKSRKIRIGKWTS